MSNANVFDTIKGLLKRRGMTYADVAERLGLSESGVKKMFSTRDCSLTRLYELADIVGIRPAELFAVSDAPAPEVVELTPRQQAWLLDRPTVFRFYWRLVIERRAVPEIQATLELDERETSRVLARLEDMRVIRIERPSGRVRVPNAEDVRWPKTGPLVEHFNLRWAAGVVEAASVSEDAVFRIMQLSMREDTATEFRERLQALVNDFDLRSRYEQNVAKISDLETMRVLVGVVPGGFID